jgi:type III secretion system chaperone SycN
MIDSIIREFGELLGMGGLELSPGGDLALEIEPSDTLCLVSSGEELFVSLSRSHQYPHTPSAARLLELLHFEKNEGQGVRCRRTDFGRTNVLMETLSVDGLRGADVLEALDRLTKLHNMAEAV